MHMPSRIAPRIVVVDPVGQSKHSVRPKALPYEPLAQKWQVDSPHWEEKLPTAHLMQRELLAAETMGW